MAQDRQMFALAPIGTASEVESTATGKNRSARSAALVALTDAQRKTILTKFDLLESLSCQVLLAQRAAHCEDGLEDLFHAESGLFIALRNHVGSSPAAGDAL